MANFDFSLVNERINTKEEVKKEPIPFEDGMKRLEEIANRKAKLLSLPDEEFLSDKVTKEFLALDDEFVSVLHKMC